MTTLSVPPTGQSATGQSPADRAALLARCAEFVHTEAELLDTDQHAAWLALYDDPAVYWLPMRADQPDALDHLNLVYDNRSRLEDRIARLRTGHAYAEEPGSQTSHLIAGLRRTGPAETARLAGEHEVGPADVALAGRFVLARSRRGTIEQHHGRMFWVLRPVGDSFRIRLKRIDLVGASDPLGVLTYLL